jgi:DNA-binding transcriptional ArsR family regulator
MVQKRESEITEVLKALNHEIRREIIRILHNEQLVPYSDFLSQLDLPASSNVAYHLSLLNKAKLIEKNPDGKYFLSPLGKRSALLLDLAIEPKSSSFSNIYLAFSRLNPLEILLGAWYIFFFMLGLLFVSSFLIIGVFFVLLSIGSIIMFVYRTRTLWTLLLLNNFIWIFFVPDNRELLISIIITNVFGLIFLIPETEFIIPIAPLEIILGGLFIFISFILSIVYIYISTGRKFPITLGKE